MSKKTIKNISKTTETGRSMVEMLGVLAVVGVLSVSGITGYTYAMDKHHTNELLAGASERAVLILSQLALSRENITLPAYANDKTSAGEFSKLDVYDDNSFGITVTGVKDSVCENLIKATAGTNIVLTNEARERLSEGSCAQDTNNLMFVFESKMVGDNENTSCKIGSEKCLNGTYYSCDEDENGNGQWFPWETGDFPAGYVCNGNTLTCDPACEEGNECVNGLCIPVVSECGDIETFWYDENGEPQIFNPVLKCNEFCEIDSVNNERNCYQTPEDMVSCSNNSDCDSWCQDKDEPCFCNYTKLYGENADSSSVVGGCAVASVRSENLCIMGVCSEEALDNWISAKNFCQAHGLGLWTVEAGVRNGVLPQGQLKDLANEYYDRWLVNNDGEPSRIEGPFIKTVDVIGQNGRATCD